MKRFPNSDAYRGFAYSVRNKRRYLLEADAKDFLDAVRRTAARRIDTIPPNVHMWRAQLGASTIELPIGETDDMVTEDYPYPTERMKPRPFRAVEGRANPKGISYLYLASHHETAVAEVRPWKAGVVSLGEFKPARALRLVNTTLESKRTTYFARQPDPVKREEAVWGDIDYAFAVPTTSSDNAAEYVPTQVLAELFREDRYDGIAYRSAYGPGHNVVLFDPSVVEHLNSVLVRIKDVHFDIEIESQFGYHVESPSAT